MSTENSKAASITHGRMADLLRNAGAFSLNAAIKENSEKNTAEREKRKQQPKKESKKPIVIKLKPSLSKKKISYLNRFGNIAEFENWVKQGFKPKNHAAICCLCGKEPSESTTWKAPNREIYRICPECFSHGQKQGDPSFKMVVPKRLRETNG